MAASGPDFGCWKCGNPHHRAWECRSGYSKVETQKIRKTTQSDFNSLHPKEKNIKDLTRASKFMEKLAFKESAVDTEVVLNTMNHIWNLMQIRNTNYRYELLISHFYSGQR
jgi:hypothetical protein